MVNKLLSICKVIYYCLLYRSKIHFSGKLSIHNNVKINIHNGSVWLGKNIAIKPGAYFSVLNGGKLSINDLVYIGRNCIIVSHDSICIGERCGIGPNVTIYDHDHCFGTEGPISGFRSSPVTIGKNCWIGAGVIILRGTVIGDGCVIGAGCVIKGNIPPYSLVTSGRKLQITPLINKYNHEE